LCRVSARRRLLLKEIGDHLGHHSAADAYLRKVDLAGLAKSPPLMEESCDETDRADDPLYRLQTRHRDALWLRGLGAPSLLSGHGDIDINVVSLMPFSSIAGDGPSLVLASQVKILTGFYRFAIARG